MTEILQYLLNLDMPVIDLLADVLILFFLFFKKGKTVVASDDDLNNLIDFHRKSIENLEKYKKDGK